MHRLLFILVFGVWFITSNGQSVDLQLIGSSGEAIQNSTAGLSYSLGEVITASSLNSSVKLTQGFQQVYESDNASTVDVIGSKLVVFPNPVKDKIFVNGVTNHSFAYQVLDAQGKLVLDGNSFNNMAIDVSTLNSASYQIRVLEENSKEVHVARFIKIQ